MMEVFYIVAMDDDCLCCFCCSQGIQVQDHSACDAIAFDKWWFHRELDGLTIHKQLS